MTLGVDRTFPGHLSPMDTKGCGRRRKTGIPEFTHAGMATQSLRDTVRERERDRARERGGARKSVTMAPTSSYLTDRRQYVARKPLFGSEQQTSILKKKSNTQPETERQWSGVDTGSYHQHTDLDFSSTGSEEVTPDSLNFSRATMSPFSTEDLASSLGVSDLRSRLNLSEEPAVGSPYVGTGSGRRSLSSPPLEVHLLTSPLSPRLSSTLLSPAYTANPHHHSRSRPADFRSGGRGGEGGQSLSSSMGYLKGRLPPALHTMSPYQANYWACAIPKTLPPSPDRRSPHWDPDREYQALLDYTYPLKPGRVVSEWDGSELRGLPQTVPGLQDSGIELDRLCSSTSLSGLDLSLGCTGRPGTRSTRDWGTVGPRLSEQRGLSKSSDGLFSSSPFSSTDPIGLYLESLDYSKDHGRTNVSSRNKGVSHHHQHGAFAPSYSPSTPAPFIRSTSVLPRPRCVGGGEWDEEFRPLPDQLEELQVLSRQVREVTAQLSQPVTASWESLERGTASTHSSTTLVEGQEAEGEERGGGEEEEREEATERGERFRNTAVHRERASSQAGRGPGPRMEPLGRGVSLVSLRDVEALMDQLTGLSLPDLQGHADPEQPDSLMHHIQMFCSNLEELIRWLYTVVERIEMLTPPAADIQSVKSSLSEYQSFQREVSAHQPLTSSVLVTGERLLSCINSTSPVLKDTLALIERQSRALETHTEHLFSSILTAMDSLTSQPRGPEPRGGPGVGAGGLGTPEVQGAVL